MGKKSYHQNQNYWGGGGGGCRSLDLNSDVLRYHAAGDFFATADQIN
jgi:hypothetical protein